MAAIRAGEAVPARINGAILGTAFSAGGSDSDDSDSSDSSSSDTATSASGSDAAGPMQRDDLYGDIESGSSYDTTVAETSQTRRFPLVSRGRDSTSGSSGCCVNVSASLGPCVRKVISIVCCPVRVSAKACGKAAKCIERAVDVDVHELHRPVQMASS